MTTQQQRTTTILFICTGNTCRSPMAEALGRSLVERQFQGGQAPHLCSAGTSAAPGMAATPEAIRAVETLGAKMPSHSSMPLSATMIEEASAVFGMTMGHVLAAQAMCPEAAGRIELLDPGGLEILDPLGYPQPVYDQAAQAIHSALQRRLSQLDSGS